VEAVYRDGHEQRAAVGAELAYWLALATSKWFETPERPCRKRLNGQEKSGGAPGAIRTPDLWFRRPATTHQNTAFYAGTLVLLCPNCAHVRV